MEFQKRHLLLVIAIVCLVLWYTGSENIPYLSEAINWLPTIGGIAYAVKNITDLAKQPNYEQLSNTQSDTKSKHTKH